MRNLKSFSILLVFALVFNLVPHQAEPVVQAADNAQQAPLWPELRLATPNLIEITDSGFTPATLTVLGPADITWVNTTNITHTLRSGEPQVDPGGTSKIYLPVIQRGSASAVEAASAYLSYLYQQAEAASFEVTLAPGQSFTYRFTTPGNYKFFLATAPALKGTLTLNGVALLRTSPAYGESEVAVTHETILEFSGPLNPASVTSAAFMAQAGNSTLDYRLNLSADKTRVTLFYKDALPGSTRVRVTVDGSKLKDAQGNNVDVDSDGAAGGSTVLEFDTLSLTVIPGTSVCGRVFASELAVTASNVSVNTPLKDVTVSVDGTELKTKTDANGNFCLNPAPVGRFFVHVDGHSATNNIPAGQYYPMVGKAWQSAPGQQTSVGDIYLPLIPANTLQSVSAAQDTQITFADSVLQAHPELNGVSILVPANSLYNDDGERGGKVGIAPVPPDRLPGGLPEGLDFPVVITVQTDGAMNFDKPAPVCFPNLPDPNTGEKLKAGAKDSLFSFNHDTGAWEAVGPMMVTADERLVCTDPGVGIRAPGWHGNGPPPMGPPPPPNPPPPPPPTTPPPTTPAPTTPPPTTPAPTTPAPTTPAPTTPAPTTPAPTMSTPPTSGTSSASKTPPTFTPTHTPTPTFTPTHTPTPTFTPTHTPTPTFTPTYTPTPTPTGCSNSNHDENKLKSCKLLAVGKASACLAWAEITFVRSMQLCPLFGELAPICLASAFAWHYKEIYDCNKNLVEESRQCEQKWGCNGSQSLLPSSSSEESVFLPFSNRSDDEKVQMISQINQQIRDKLYKYVISGQDIPPSLLNEIKQLQERSNSIADGDTGKFLQTYALEREYENALVQAGIGLADGNAPAYPVLYMAVIQRPSSTYQIRGKTLPYGQYQIFVPRNGNVLAIYFYDPVTNASGAIHPNLRADAQYRFDRFYLQPPSDAEIDSDNDKLPDEIEFVVGTDPNNPDTDNDGISDGAEVAQGTDPLGGFIAQTGIIGSADTPGTAVDICVQNDLAVVADSAAGVAIFNVFDSTNPKLVAQVDTPGSALAVACAGNRIAVADDTQGLAVIDISNMASARIVQKINVGTGGANEIAVVGNYAYIASGNEVILIDMLSGTILDREAYVGGNVHDLSISGDYLYVLIADGISPQIVHKIFLSDTLEPPVASVTVQGHPTFGRTHLFAGGDLIYVGAIDDNFSNQTPGIGIIQDLGGTLSLIGPPSAITAFDVEANGSGLVLYTGADASLTANARFAVLDVKDPTQTDNFITAFDTPGSATAIAVYQGRAYIADSSAGLQVINYLAYDNKKTPPTIGLTTNFAPGKAEEDALLRVTATTGDDVQVRSVEFYLDGTLLATDGTFPFETRFVTPRLAQQPTIKLRARAVDTGGNETWTDEQTVTLTTDATPPRVINVSPSTGAIGAAGETKTISVTFTEAIAPSSVTNTSFKLFTFGADNIPGTDDDTPVPNGNTTILNPTTAQLSFATGLPANRYRAVLTNAVTDAAGNSLAKEFVWIFQLVPVIRIGDVVSNAIGVPNEKDIYHFSATAGQQVFFDLQQQSGLSVVNWNLTDETGAVIFDTCLGCGEVGVQTLARGGTYTLTVGDDRDPNVGSYRIQLWNVPAPHTFNIAIGDTISNGVPSAGAGAIETPGVKDIYHFSATAGQQVFFDLQQQSGLSVVNWNLTDETGAVIFDTCLGCGEVGVQTLARGGTYTLTVGDDRDPNVGSYRIQLWNVPAPHTFNIAIGDTVSNGVPSAGAGAIETPGVKDIYHFSATAGQQVFFDLQQQSGLSVVNWNLTDETGAVIFDTCLGCGEVGVQTLARGGTYTLTVGDDRDPNVGSYRIQLWNVPAPHTFNIAIGDTISNGVPSAGAGAIETPGVKDIYHFSATAGQQVFFDLQQQSGLSGMMWKLTDETGAELFNTCFGCGTTGVKTLAHGGTYTLTVGDDRDAAVGTYRFKLIAQ